jgi:transposase
MSRARGLATASRQKQLNTTNPPPTNPLAPPPARTGSWRVQKPTPGVTVQVGCRWWWAGRERCYVSRGEFSYEQLAVLVVEQAAVIEELRVEVAGLRSEVVELKRRLAQNSRNSSRPPSSDGLSKPPPRSLRRPSGRKPGGQQGHQGGHLEKVAAPDEVVDHVPLVCAGCQGGLSDEQDVGRLARQVFDLPEIRLRVSEHRAHIRRCECGQETTAAFPEAVTAPAQYGPRVRALGLYLVSYQHLPYARAAAVMSDWLGAPVSTGTLAAFIACGAEDLGPFLDDVHAQITAAPVAHFDETGARAEGKLRWLFSASTSQATFFSLHDKRGCDGLNHAGVLPSFTGVAVHDGFKPYRDYTNLTHALCNVHHLRELLGVIEQAPDDPDQEWAVRMDKFLRKLQTIVRHARHADRVHLDPSQLTRIETAYEQIITLGHQTNPAGTIKTGKRGPIRQTPARNLLLRLDHDRDAVLRFAHDFRVPFDNNQAERDIRMIKLQQKISGCWRTITGAEHFLAIRAYLSTANKNHQPMASALIALAARDPWQLPIAASP